MKPPRPHRFEPLASSVRVGAQRITIELRDGRLLAVPTTWFPRLKNASLRQRQRWELIGRGIGIHWPDIDEDISVENLLSTGKMLSCRE